MSSNSAQCVENDICTKKVQITITTYPDLQPFLEMAAMILEGAYEYGQQIENSQNVQLDSVKSLNHS
jgi:hypothetical protein